MFATIIKLNNNIPNDYYSFPVNIKNMKLFILWHYRLGVKSEKFSGLPLRTLIELKPLAKTLYSLKLNNNGFQSIPNLLQGNTTFDKLRSLDISHNPIKGK